TVYSKITGTADAPNIRANSDLSATEIVYAGILNKPANVPFKSNASMSRTEGVLRVSHAELILASLQARATNLIFENNSLAGRIDTNNFDVAPVSRMLVVAQRYNATGNVEIHSDVRFGNHEPSGTGTITLTRINATLPGTTTLPLGDLSGTIQMAG